MSREQKQDSTSNIGALVFLIPTVACVLWDLSLSSVVTAFCAAMFGACAASSGKNQEQQVRPAETVVPPPVVQFAPRQRSELLELRTRIQGDLTSRGLSEIMQEPLNEIDRLVEVDRQLGVALATYNGYLASNAPDDVRGELTIVTRKLEATNEVTKPLLLQNKEVLEMRLEKLQSIETSREAAETQRHIILDSVKLLRDQILAANSSEDLRVPVEHLKSMVRITDSLLVEVSGLLAKPVS